jgi:ubiquinone biosynthesis protein UbiJ
VDNVTKVVYPSQSKYAFTRADVEDLRAELERLRVAIKELQDRVDRLEQAG